MQCLTVQQPWASAIVAGAKRVENRSRPTQFRGRLFIHAGKKTDPAGAGALAAAGVELTGDLPAGAIIGCVDVVDCRAVGDRDLFDDGGNDPLATGPYCWILRNPIRFDVPIECNGQLGLWRVPADLVERVERAAGGQAE